MNDELNKKCKICGKKYHCDCGKYKTMQSWREHTDDINCYKIFTIINDYCNKNINANKANKLLQDCDLSDIENFNSWIIYLIKLINEESTND
jgi:hypothetical protein